MVEEFFTALLGQHIAAMMMFFLFGWLCFLTGIGAYIIVRYIEDERRY